MTTARSPLRVLKAQADRIARAMKAAERGENIADDPAGKIVAARVRESVKVAVAMDDKILTIELTWKMIAATSEVALSEFILKNMREKREDA